jgi:hypothetical protein
MASANIYCIGVFKENDIMYFPELEIYEVTPTTDSVNISIKSTTTPDSSITLTYLSSGGDLLNTSPSNAISKDIKPEQRTMTGSDPKLKTFFEKLDSGFVPFCLAMQFYVADDSGETSKKSLSDWMTVSSSSTDSNRKGDLMCDLYYDIFVGHDVITKYSCFAKTNSIEIDKGAGPIPLKNDTSTARPIIVAVSTGATGAAGPTGPIISTKGGGLKRNLAVQTAIPRIYRQVLNVHKTAERRTDYYKYA